MDILIALGCSLAVLSAVMAAGWGLAMRTGNGGWADTVWTFGVGCGPVGSLAVGLAAARVGAPVTQLVAGAILLVLTVGLSFNRALRTLR